MSLSQLLGYATTIHSMRNDLVMKINNTPKFCLKNPKIKRITHYFQEENFTFTHTTKTKIALSHAYLTCINAKIASRSLQDTSLQKCRIQLNLSKPFF